MAARRLALLVAVLGLSTVIACDRGSLTAPTSTSSNGVPTITASNVAAVGIAVQEISSQTFLLLGGSFAQLGSLSAVQDSGPTLGTTVRTIDWSMACPDGGTRGISGTVTASRSNGSGVLQTDLQLSFTNCDMGRVTLQGNPGIALTGQTTFQDGIPDTHTFQKTGGLIFTVPSGVEGSVQFNCTVTWSRPSGPVSATGTVSWEFPIGTPVAGPGCAG